MYSRIPRALGEPGILSSTRDLSFAFHSVPVGGEVGGWAGSHPIADWKGGLTTRAAFLPAFPRLRLIHLLPRLSPTRVPLRTQVKNWQEERH